MRYNYDLLISFCNSNTILLLKEYKNDNMNRDTRICGKCITDNCLNEFDKSFRRLYKMNGYCRSCTNKFTLDKNKATNLERYGVEHPMQNAEVSEKASKNAYKLKQYTWPSGAIINVQGYEPYALDELLREGITEDKILTKRTDVPKVWWCDKGGKKHRYFVDIFIPFQNRCVEVKSRWTFEIKKDIVFDKQQALKDAGYKCEIWIYNAKGEKVEYYI